MNITIKTLILSACIIAATGCGRAQTRETAHAWRATLTVVDENQQPVAGAQVWVAYDDPKEGQPIDPLIKNDWAVGGLTDTNGIFMAAHFDRAVLLGFHAQKAGYYPYFAQYNLGFNTESTSARWNPSATLVLKRVIKPVPMYAKSVNLGMPVFDKPAGFDLKAGDWVAPYGKGSGADIVFTAHLEQRTGNDSDYKLVVSFPNPGDGIQEFLTPILPSGEGSLLRSHHSAPMDGYQAEWIQTSVRKPGQPAVGNRDRNRNFFLRVQTTLDEAGHIKSAMYGKIYGDFLQFSYFLNPTANDRNVEFDPAHNLMINLESFEQVRAP